MGKRWNCVPVDFLWNLKLSISFADFQLNGHVSKCLWPSCDPNGRSISHTQLHGGQVTVVQLRTWRCLSHDALKVCPTGFLFSYVLPLPRWWQIAHIPIVEGGVGHFSLIKLTTPLSQARKCVQMLPLLLPLGGVCPSEVLGLLGMVALGIDISALLSDKSVHWLVKKINTAFPWYFLHRWVDGLSHFLPCPLPPILLSVCFSCFRVEHLITSQGDDTKRGSSTLSPSNHVLGDWMLASAIKQGHISQDLPADLWGVLLQAPWSQEGDVSVAGLFCQRWLCALFYYLCLRRCTAIISSRLSESDLLFLGRGEGEGRRGLEGNEAAADQSEKEPAYLAWRSY